MPTNIIPAVCDYLWFILCCISIASLSSILSSHSYCGLNSSFSFAKQCIFREKELWQVANGSFRPNLWTLGHRWVHEGKSVGRKEKVVLPVTCLSYHLSVQGRCYSTAQLHHFAFASFPFSPCEPERSTVLIGSRWSPSLPTIHHQPVHLRIDSPAPNVTVFIFI